jgi:hypothetical protein
MRASYLFSTVSLRISGCSPSTPILIAAEFGNRQSPDQQRQ